MMVITIDGPTASGKSSAARMLAHELGFNHLSSGFLFRALAYLLITKAGYTLKSLANPSQDDITTYLDREHLNVRFSSDGVCALFFDGQDITPFLKTPLMDQGSSYLGVHSLVRDVLGQMQRALAVTHNLVVDGRDAGSAIFPHAQVKFFLTAALEVRAQRWFNDQHKKGSALSLQDARQQLVLRDHRDSERAMAPLQIPEGAHVIDSTLLTIDEVVARMVQEISRDVL